MLKGRLGWTVSCRFASGTNAYTSRSHTCGELSIANKGEAVSVMGWLTFKRMDRFLVLRDAYGTVQATIPEHLQATVKQIPYESVLRVDGVVEDRGANRTTKMATGDIEIKVSSLSVLNKAAQEMPFLPEANAGERTRLKHRYIDLRSQRLQRALRLRSKLVHDVRKFLVERRNFVDVETPTLFRRTPGGAAEFVVPASAPNLGLAYSLPQSPQQFKQLLMVGGIDRYFQVARCYRDEGSKGDRQPEFTQIDLEMSFTHQDGVMQLVEEMLLAAWPESLGNIKPASPFPRIAYSDAMRLYGSDKPDMRIPWRIEDSAQFPAGIRKEHADWTAKMFVCRGVAGSVFTGSNKKEWKRLVMMNSLGRPFIVCKPEKRTSVFANAADVEKNHELGGEDVVVVSWGPSEAVQWTLGQLRNLVADAAGLRARKEVTAHWVVEFPLFTEEEGQLTSTHHPFTAPVDEHVDDLNAERNLKGIHGQHYDLVINGVEMGGGSIRIHDSQLQHLVLRILGEPTDEMTHLLEAFRHGAPPHGGFALGLDRFVALLCAEGDPSLPVREVIAFPKTKEGKDLMSDSPATVTENLQKRFGISFVENKGLLHKSEGERR